jgi:hypothetical protein
MNRLQLKARSKKNIKQVKTGGKSKVYYEISCPTCGKPSVMASGKGGARTRFGEKPKKNARLMCTVCKGPLNGSKPLKKSSDGV